MTTTIAGAHARDLCRLTGRLARTLYVRNLPNATVGPDVERAVTECDARVRGFAEARESARRPRVPFGVGDDVDRRTERPHKKIAVGCGGEFARTLDLGDDFDRKARRHGYLRRRFGGADRQHGRQEKREGASRAEWLHLKFHDFESIPPGRPARRALALGEEKLTRGWRVEPVSAPADAGASRRPAVPFRAPSF